MDCPCMHAPVSNYYVYEPVYPAWVRTDKVSCICVNTYVNGSNVIM